MGNFNCKESKNHIENNHFISLINSKYPNIKLSELATNLHPYDDYLIILHSVFNFFN